MEEQELLPRLLHDRSPCRSFAGGEPLFQRRFDDRNGAECGHGCDRGNTQLLPMNRDCGSEFTAKQRGGVVECDGIGVNAHRGTVRLMGSLGPRRYIDERTVHRARRH